MPSHQILIIDTTSVLSSGWFDDLDDAVVLTPSTDSAAVIAQAVKCGTSRDGLFAGTLSDVNDQSDSHKTVVRHRQICFRLSVAASTMMDDQVARY